MQVLCRQLSTVNRKRAHGKEFHEASELAVVYYKRELKSTSNRAVYTGSTAQSHRVETAMQV